MCFEIRAASEEAVPVIYDFIRKLARYEKLEHQVIATEQDIKETLFGAKPYAEVFIGYEQEKPVGMALVFTNYSTFLGRPGMYLEDLFIDEVYRGKGYGKQFLTFLARKVVERNYGRLEWAVLDWNDPARAFYKKIGATEINDWIINRVTGEALRQLANEA